MNTPTQTPQAPNPPNPTQPPPPEPAADIMQEVRFAVVLYGGVSLAIYINGVAQQLLDTVRSTATAVGEESKLVYREGELNASGKIFRRIAKFLNSRMADDSILKKDDPSVPVRTKFVVDVISGTSAGGLNGIFLGKALANDQSMGPLQNLWMTEGDLGRLLNDSESVKDEPALNPEKVAEPESLLNSERMYEKLLTALHGMDFPRGNRFTDPDSQTAGRKPSPLVEELDVFITTTDLSGLPIHIQLTNTVADERRHRNVFRFRYCTAAATGEERDDFGVKCNPFLAFAGRSTSSFPFAFEPMRLSDVWPVLAHWETYRRSRATFPQDWGRFYEDYTKGGENFEDRAFGDGGYLDNKPFTYATRTLMRRRAVCPVVRKLLYVEPEPERITPGGGSGERPNVIANITAALLTLPRYETIHDDLQDILERNKMFRQLARLTERLDEDVAERPTRTKEGTDYERTQLVELVETHGVFYGTYHRLKVEEVTGNLASAIALALDFDPQSDEREALRLILTAWRAENYTANGPADGRKYESNFLLSFDFGYRLRRLFFIQARINRLSAVAATEEIQAELRKIKKVVADAVRQLRIAERTLHRDPEFRKLISAAINGEAAPLNGEAIRAALLAVLVDPDSAAGIARSHAAPIRRIADHISEYLGVVFRKVAGDMRDALPDSLALQSPGSGAAEARREIARVYREFEWYDMVIFPIQQGSDSAESNHVDIIRVSPVDSPNLIPGGGAGRNKLAGTALWAFGAFLARAWRENDMLWGKLDAAEILIRNLLSGDPRAGKETVDGLVDELHRAILNESVTPEMRKEMYDLICAALAENPRDVSKAQAVRELVSKLGDLDERLKKVLRCCLDEDELLTYFKTKYEVNRNLAAKDTLRLAGRAARVVGKMAEVLGDGTRVSAQAKFFSHLASGLWALVEISVPRSFAWNEVRHVRALCYLIGLVLLGLGVFWHPAMAPGAVILSATLALHVITAWLHGLMQAREAGGKGIGRWLLIGLAAVAVGLASWGAIDLANRFQRWANRSAAEPATK